MRTTKLLIAAAVAAAATPALAGNTVTVAATLSDSCTLDTTSATLEIGTAVKTGATVQGSYDVWCTSGYAVKVNASSANGWLLKSANPAITDTIGYGLYSDSGATTAFSNVAYTGTALTTASRVSYYVKPTASNPKASTYTDTVTFTVAP